MPPAGERNRELERRWNERIAAELKRDPAGPLAKMFQQMRLFAASPASRVMRELAQEAAGIFPVPGSLVAKTLEIAKQQAALDRANRGKLSPLHPRNFVPAAAPHGTIKPPRHAPTDQEILTALAEYKRLHDGGRRDACRAVANKLGIKPAAVDRLYRNLSEELRQAGRPRNPQK